LDEQRGDGPQGSIGFAISARMSEALHQAILQVPEGAVEVYGEPHPQEIRECAEIDFVPGEKSEHKDTKPLRYVAIRIRPRQEALFSDNRKSTRLNSSHVKISYAVFCLKKKKNKIR